MGQPFQKGTYFWFVVRITHTACAPESRPRNSWSAGCGGLSSSGPLRHSAAPSWPRRAVPSGATVGFKPKAHLIGGDFPLSPLHVTSFLPNTQGSSAGRQNPDQSAPLAGKDISFHRCKIIFLSFCALALYLLISQPPLSPPILFLCFLSPGFLSAGRFCSEEW